MILRSMGLSFANIAAQYCIELRPSIALSGLGFGPIYYQLVWVLAPWADGRIVLPLVGPTAGLLH